MCRRLRMADERGAERELTRRLAQRVPRAQVQVLEERQEPE